MKIDDILSNKVLDKLKWERPSNHSRIFETNIRFLDILISLILIIFLSPIILSIACLIKASDRGPVFFRQERSGLLGEPFKIIKFRTMIENAHQIGAKYKIEKNDPRITKIGILLRKYHLDELPQLFNVLHGKMTLVGPRPTLVWQKDYYEEWEKQRLNVKPGMTGLSQVIGGNMLSWDNRIIIDVYYVQNRSLLLNMYIIFKTIIVLIKKEGHEKEEGGVNGWTRSIPPV
jgi:lipopolysaccharide/colanic/teichoic acid biosynthesis glycosyltransferase